MVIVGMIARIRLGVMVVVVEVVIESRRVIVGCLSCRLRLVMMMLLLLLVLLQMVMVVEIRWRKLRRCWRQRGRRQRRGTLMSRIRCKPMMGPVRIQIVRQAGHVGHWGRKHYSAALVLVLEVACEVMLHQSWLLLFLLNWLLLSLLWQLLLMLLVRLLLVATCG